MSNLRTYIFYLDTGGTPQAAYPVYGNDFAKIVTKPEGQEYYRETLQGELTFLRNDYDLIAATDIETQINCNIYYTSGCGSTTEQLYFSGYFTKTDCTFDVNECNEGIVKVSLSTNDYYDKILAGIDKEFDLIELEPAKTPFTYSRQPIFQVYEVGANVLTCYLGGTYFELDVPSPVSSTTDLFSTYFFGYAGTHLVIYGDNLDPDVSGEYINDVSLDTLSTSPSYIRKGDGTYKIRANGATEWEIYDAVGGTVRYRSAAGAALFDTSFTSTFGATTAYSRGRNVFTRFITNQTTVGVTPTSAIPDPDIVSNPSGYDRVLAIGLTNVDVPAGTDWENVIIASAGNASTPTRYGKFADDAPLYSGEYFAIPTGAGSGAIYPQGQSNWDNASFWFQYDATLRNFQESGAEALTVQDGYKLADSLSVILTQLNPSVTHQENSDHSDFFYGASNAIRGALRYPIITPKSNISVGEYDQPAKKGPIRLSDIEQLLWNVFRCKWHIDSSGAFIVEHISFYENGGTYTGTTVGTDLTTQIDPQTGKNWGWGRNRWSYEKASMPERIEPGWMDRTTREFDGYPIVIRSNYVQKGNIGNQKAGRFTSDIDYIQLQPEDIAKEGFAIVDTELISTVYTVPYVTITLPDSTQFKLQNGYLAFIWLHPNYHRYGLPASLITLNEEDTTAMSVTRRKVQEIEYPEFTTTDYLALVTTAIGSGKLLEIEENIPGQYLRVKIAHDTA